MTAIESTLETAQWDEDKVPHWINEICEKTMKSLGELKFSPYKFIVTVMLVQKTDKALFNCFSTLYENNCDGIETVMYPPPRNKDSFSKTIQCYGAVMAVRY